MDPYYPLGRRVCHSNSDQVFSCGSIFILTKLKLWLMQAWGWMEWKEGNIVKARELYQRALLIDSASKSAARCLQVVTILVKL